MGGVFGFSPFSVLRKGLACPTLPSPFRNRCFLPTEAICLHAELLPWLRQSTLLPGECPLQRGGGSNGRTLWEPHIARRLATGSIPVVWPSNCARRDLAQLTWPKHTWNIMEPLYQPSPRMCSLGGKDQPRGKGVATQNPILEIHDFFIRVDVPTSRHPGLFVAFPDLWSVLASLPSAFTARSSRADQTGLEKAHHAPLPPELRKDLVNLAICFWATVPLASDTLGVGG